MAGILIYTASNDSDGSLGGLVQQGTTHRLAVLLEEALQGAISCSSDPLCRELRPGQRGTVNGTACHACLLVPETACECSNRMLDRALIVNLPKQSDLAFFSL